VHRHRVEVRDDLPRLERRVADFVEVSEVALGIDLSDEGALAVLRGEQPETGGNGRLTDATLAGDEDQLPIED